MAGACGWRVIISFDPALAEIFLFSPDEDLPRGELGGVPELEAVTVMDTASREGELVAMVPRRSRPIAFLASLCRCLAAFFSSFCLFFSSFFLIFSAFFSSFFRRFRSLSLVWSEACDGAGDAEDVDVDDDDDAVVGTVPLLEVCGVCVEA